MVKSCKQDVEWPVSDGELIPLSIRAESGTIVE